MRVAIAFIATFIFFAAAQKQQEFALQFIGDSVTVEEQSEKDFCESKYCLLDATNLFVSATQNKSAQPCNDFKEFALGTFIKYRALSDRNAFSGFGTDVRNSYLLRLRKAVAAKVNKKDTRVTRAIKKFFAKCVSSAFITQNGINLIRDYLRLYDLKFYPEKNGEDMKLKEFIEGEPQHAMDNLLRHQLSRFDYRGHFGFLQLTQISFLHKNKWFSSLKEILYDMNRVYLNSSFAEQFNEEFNEIAQSQEKFYDLLQEKVFYDKTETPKVILMTINGLNQLTASLDIDWLKIVNKLLLTEVGANEVIAVHDPHITQRLSDFLATANKKSVADFFVYNFLALKSPFFMAYSFNEWKHSVAGAKKDEERWSQCIFGITHYMGPAVESIYLRRYQDKALERSMSKFARETIDFAIRGIKTELNDEVLANVVKRLKWINIVVGYPKEFANARAIDEMYDHDLTSDGEQNFVDISLKIINHHEKILREPITSRRRKLEELAKNFDIGFKYFPYDNILYIPLMYCHYPFYHQQRPRFFNTATVSNLINVAMYIGLSEYLRNEWNVTNFKPSTAPMQVSYEFYDDWLKSGGKDLELGAHRLTNRQLFWVASARHFYAKVQSSEIKSPQFASFGDVKENVHWRVARNRGFHEAFNCK